MSEVKVNKLSPRSGTTVTLGDSGDTISIPSGVTLDASSGGLAGTLTTAAQPNITQTGTLTSFTSTGIDDNATSTAITIDSSGRVSIRNTASTTRDLHVGDISGATSMEIKSASNSTGTIFFGDTASGASGRILYDHTDNYLRLDTNGSERMRINSSGNLLVGTTSTDPAFGTTTGFEAQSSGQTHISGSGTGLIVNRTASDGTLAQFRKGGTTIGSLETASVGGSGRLIVKSTTFDGYLDRAGTTIAKWMVSSFTPGADNTFDLGRSSERWDDVFATNGTIQTSDQNEKQSIQSLTTAEMNVGKRLSPLIKTFKWNSSVEEKGDNARTHTGIIAQDVQQAFADEGLDASNYALFCSDTWWEKEISVEATEEKKAYTYMDTKEEATDGYTEKTRLGVRYPELLSFIQAYNDQRFTELEARITTLENA